MFRQIERKLPGGLVIRWLTHTAVTPVVFLLGVTLFLHPTHCGAASLDSASFTNDPLLAPAIAVLHPDKALLETVTTAGARLVAGGEHGVIIISDDEGASWRQVGSPADVTINQIRFVDSRTGWAVGNFGVVLKTLDGGLTWTKQLDGVQAANLMLMSAQQGVTAAPDDPAAAKRLRHAKLFVSDGPDKPFLFIQIFDAQHLRMYGAYGMVFETHDGGADWADWSAHVTDPGHLHPYGLVNNAGKTLVAGEQGMLLSGPTDGPIQPMPTPSPYQGSFFGIVQSAADGLVAFGLVGNIYESKDQGASWSQAINQSSSTINCAMLTRDGQVLVGDWDGNVSLVAGAKVIQTGTNAGFPISDMLEAPDRSLILVGMNGVRRIPPALWLGTLAELKN